MSTTAPDNRITTYNPVVATTVFEALFPVFDNDDLAVFLNGEERTDFVVSATYVEGVATDAKVTFASGLIGKVDVVGNREPHRTNKFGPGPIPVRDFNLAFDTLESEMQEARRDISRALLAPYGETLPNTDQIIEAAATAVEAAEAAQAAAASVNIKNVADRSELKSLNPSNTTLAFLREDGREGLFKWTIGNYSSKISADTLEGIFIKANSVAATTGAWVRQSGWALTGLEIVWFGADATGTSDSAAAIQAAINLASTLSITTVCVRAGLFITSTQIQIPKGIIISGQGLSSQIKPSAAITSLFSINGGMAGVRSVKTVGASLATHAIIVNKPAGDSDLWVDVSRCFATTFAGAFVRWLDGDVFKMRDNFLIDCLVALDVINDCRNSQIENNYVLGGSGFRFNKLSSGGQGVEGALIKGNTVLPASGGAFCLRLLCGLEVAVIGNVFDQVINGDAVSIDGTNASIDCIKFESNWLGRQSGAAGATFGIYVVGNVTNLISKGDTFVGWRSAGFYSGTVGTKKNFKIIDPIFYSGDKCVRDIELNSVTGVLISGAVHNGTTSIVEGSGVTGRVINGDYVGSALPSSISGGLRYGQQVAGFNHKNKGIAVMPAAGSAVVVNHGLSFAPSQSDIFLTPTASGTSDPGLYFIPSVTSSQFTIAPRAAPGSDVPVAWSVDISR